MARQFVTKLSDGEAVDEVYLASEKQLRPNRSGNLYLQFRCSDKSGMITAMLWNADQKHFDSFENGSYVRVRATAQFYNNNMQLIVKQISRVNTQEVDATDFQAKSSQDIDHLFRRLCEILRRINDYHLRNLAETFLLDEQIVSQVRRAPAGVKNHHAYSGGLLEHVVKLLELVEVVAPLYPELDVDQLKMGAFLHDIGKIEELTYSPDLGYSDRGQLLGHLVLGSLLLDRKIAETEKQNGEKFPDELALRLHHLIISHHGELELGSPKVPMTMEALVLHHLDNLDAKMGSFRQVLAEDVSPAATWTTYHPQLGRKIFKGKSITMSDHRPNA